MRKGLENYLDCDRIFKNIPRWEKEETMKYSVKTNVEGIDTIIDHDLTLDEAIEIAEAESENGNDAYITWYRASDGQHGYYNKGEGHTITGKAW